MTHPNWEEGLKRNFRCKLCRRQPPDVTFNHFKSSTICAGCQVTLASAWPIAFVILGVLVLWRTALVLWRIVEILF